MNKKMAWLSGIFVLAMIGVVTVAQAVSVEPGSSKVSVYSCVQVGNDVKIRRSSTGSEYILTSTCRDAGHGKRQYTMKCNSNKEYQVSWTECGTSAPVPQPSYVLESMKVSALGNGTNMGYLKTNNNYWGMTYVTVPSTWPTYNVELKTKSNLPNAGTYTYAFGVEDHNGEVGVTVDEKMVKQMVKNISFGTSLNRNFSVSDSNRNKTRTIIGFARNNDGVSRVPNMPVEVDDFIVIHVFLAPKDVSAPTLAVTANVIADSVSGNTFKYQVNVNATDLDSNIKGIWVAVRKTDGSLVQEWWVDNKNGLSVSEAGFGTKNVVRNIGKTGLVVGEHYKVYARAYDVKGNKSANVTAAGELYVANSDNVTPTIDANVSFASVWDIGNNSKRFVPTVFAKANDNIKVVKIVLYHNTTQLGEGYNVVKTCENSNGVTGCSHTFGALTRGNFYAQAWDVVGNSVTSVKYSF
ncbi:MAG: hypothetical protein KAZ30_03150 [Candidatus Magasanikbacteria bacterium]|nr:hypothetical protein [Candidatus Magasanikbacteria bacterium]